MLGRDIYEHVVPLRVALETLMGMTSAYLQIEKNGDHEVTPLVNAVTTAALALTVLTDDFGSETVDECIALGNVIKRFTSPEQTS